MKLLLACTAKELLSTGVSTNPSCLVSSLERCAVHVTQEVFELVWPAVKAVLRGATVSTFRGEEYWSCAVLAVCKRLHIQTECRGGSVPVA